MRALLNLLDWETQQRVLELRARLRNSKRLNRYSFDSVSTSSKHVDPAKVIDRLLRYQRCLGEEISFENKVVLEIGAGPLLGWALSGLALGAKKYIVLEPAMDLGLIATFKNYFKQHRRYVTQALGSIDGIDELIADGRIEIVTGNAGNTGLFDSSVDLVISNSVLEHIPDLSELSTELDRIVTDDAEQWHFVDLKDHRGSEDPFVNLYSRDPDDLRRLYRWRGLNINMLRAPDIIGTFSTNFETEATTLLGDAGYSSIRNAHPYWISRYSPEELGTEVMALHVKGRAKDRNLVAG